MPDVDDIITDIASIVTSVRPREIMTLKRIEEDYRAIYNNPIPFYDYGFSSLSDLLEHFPSHFQFSMADGMLVIRTNVKNNITALIAKERQSKKPKNFLNNTTHSVSLFKKHKRREMKMEAELPAVMLKSYIDLIKQYNGKIHKSALLMKFKEHTGYECKFLDYGFIDETDLLNYLNGNVLLLRSDFIYSLPSQGPSIFILLSQLLSCKTGYSLSILQNRLNDISSISTPLLMKAQGHVNFVDVIYDADARGIVSYDHDLVYGPLSARDDNSRTFSIYPSSGVCRVKIVSVVSPGDFTIEIVSTNNNNITISRDYLHENMQRFAVNEPLLAMFKYNRYCSFEYDGEWFRVRLGDVCVSKERQTVSVYFLDFNMETEGGYVDVSLPTDRLRYLPREFEATPGFVHRVSLAYVTNGDSSGSRQWNSQACEGFKSLVMDNERYVYDCYLVNNDGSSVSVDIVALNRLEGDRVSIFQTMVERGFAESLL